jgi:hypothetical protein
LPPSTGPTPQVFAFAIRSKLKKSTCALML